MLTRQLDGGTPDKKSPVSGRGRARSEMRNGKGQSTKKGHGGGSHRMALSWGDSTSTQNAVDRVRSYIGIGAAGPSNEKAPNTLRVWHAGGTRESSRGSHPML
jgi:hypothetical protein